MKKFAPPIVLCILLVAICAAGCDLFNGPKVDVIQKISEEKRWADAPKLSVKVEFPSIWGTSMPQQGNITPAMDIRLDYEFSVEFIPDSVYSLQAWEAYFTEDLEKLIDEYGSSWVDSPDLIANVTSLGPEDITLPDAAPSGGTFKFTIHTVKPVTLVPSCDTKPRITRTDPLDSRGNNNSQPVSRASDITLYFNGALNRETVVFADVEGGNGIWIAADTDEDNNDKKWYSDPEYASVGGFFTVTMYCLTMPPENSLMTVTVKGIENAQGEKMDEQGFSFSWKTSSAQNVGFTSWSAEYFHNQNNNSGRIVVEYKQTGADEEDGVKIYYRMNKGAKTEFSGDINASGPDYSGVQADGQITGIREYEIIIELYAQGIMENKASIKIWNIPGMKVSKDNPAVEISNLAELEAIKAWTMDNFTFNKQYVLAKDIAITGVWTPIGGMDENNPPFSGNFYGNGHKITFNNGSSIVGAASMYGLSDGLFGYVDGVIRDEHGNETDVKYPVIRDFTLEYKNEAPISVTVNNTQDQGVFIGGVAGYLNNANVSNVITSGGTFDVSFSGNGTVSLGGIAGQINSGKMENCRAALSVNYTSNGHNGDVNIGAVAGGAKDGDTDNILKFDNGSSTSPESLSGLLINGVTVAANVSADKKSNNGDINIGGAVGKSDNGTLNKITFINGTVSYSENSKRSSARPPSDRDPDPLSNNNCGGIVGYSSVVNIVDCSFSGNIENSIATNAASIGGLAGRSSTGYDNTADDIYIHNCRVRANILLNNNTINDESVRNGIMVGGVFGDLGNTFYNENGEIITDPPCHLYLTKSFFEDGKITVNKSIKHIQLGGVIAALYQNIIINNCGIRKGTISLEAIGNTAVDTADTLLIGGFSPYLMGNVYNSFSKIDIILDNVNSKNCIVGGFVAQIDRGMTLENCYAAGTVSVAGNASEMMKVGGLVGVSGGMIKNCYALGNVQADNREPVISESSGFGQAVVGGLVGHCEDGNDNEDYGLIENCFSAGQVSAKSLYQATAGGIVGTGKKIMKTAVLGKSVTAKGMLVFTPAESPSVSNPNPKPFFYLRSTVGRINGEHDSYRKGVKNYAFNKMIIEEGDYSSNDPGTRGAQYVSRLEAVDENDVELVDGKEVVKSYEAPEKGEIVTREGIFKVITANGYKVAYYDNYENIFEDKNNNEWVPVDLTTTRDGQNASSSTFLNQSFWKTTLTFSDNVWDFSRVARDGHPSLKNVEGQ